MFGSTELIVIGLIVFILFGASAIPKFARSLGQARQEFNDGVKEANQVVEENASQEKKDASS